MTETGLAHKISDSPLANVATTSPASYMSLMTEARP